MVVVAVGSGTEEEQQNKLQTMALNAGITTARWTLATLSLINGSALLALTRPPMTADLISSGKWFVFGLVSAVVCGFALVVTQWSILIVVGQLSDRSKDDYSVPKTGIVTVVAGVLTATLAGCSLVFFVAGSLFAAKALKAGAYSQPAARAGAEHRIVSAG